MPVGEKPHARRRLPLPCTAVIGVVALVIAGGCGDRTSYRPAAIDDAHTAHTPPGTTTPAPDARGTAKPSPGPTSRATTKPAEQAVDVCGLLPPERLGALLHRKRTPRAESAPSQDGGGAVPGMGRVSQCTYSFAKGQTTDRVKVAVMPATGQKDAAAFVRAVLGPGSTGLSGAGDAAGVKAGVGGYGMKLVAAARPMHGGIAGVTVLVPQKTRPTVNRAVVNEVFGHLD